MMKSLSGPRISACLKGLRKYAIMGMGGGLLFYSTWPKGVGAIHFPVSRLRLNMDENKINQLLEAYRIRGWFQGSVVIERGGVAIYERSFDSPLMPKGSGGSINKSYRIGSVTKQFTAIAILLLQEKNLISVSDSVRTHLPNLRALDKGITISDLLSHTSGLNDDYMDTEEFRQLAEGRATLNQLIDFAFTRPIFNDSKRHSYANINYNLLARIIELKNDQNLSYAHFMDVNIFRKAHLNSASVSKSNGAISNGIAGYSWDFEGRRKRAMKRGLYQIAYGSGAINMAPKDLCKWDRELRVGNILSAQSVQAMNSPIDVGSGYGYGVVIKEENGIRMANHEGSIDGFLTYYTRFIDEDVCVAVTINQDTAPGGVIGKKLLDILINKNPRIPEIPVKGAHDADMEEIAGTYLLTGKVNTANSLEIPGPWRNRLIIEKHGQDLYIKEGIDPGNIRLARIKRRSYYLVQTGDGELTFDAHNSTGKSEIKILLWNQELTYQREE